jgi:hypothetical protein
MNFDPNGQRVDPKGLKLIGDCFDPVLQTPPHSSLGMVIILTTQFMSIPQITRITIITNFGVNVAYLAMAWTLCQSLKNQTNKNCQEEKDSH